MYCWLQGLSEAVWQMTIQSQEGSGMDAVAGGRPGQFPERLGEPDCVYYMRTGLCGFGQTCRFNHPPNRKLVRDNLTTSICLYIRDRLHFLCCRCEHWCRKLYQRFAWFGILWCWNYSLGHWQKDIGVNCGWCTKEDVGWNLNLVET